MPEISVVIPAHNKSHELPFCLESLVSQSKPKDTFEVILVNDASTDRTEEIAVEFDARLNLNHISTGEKSVGLARVRNIGGRAAKSPILIFLDADIIVGREFVESHLAAHASSDKLVNLGYLYAVDIDDDTWFRTSRIWKRFRFLRENKTSEKALRYFWFNLLRRSSSRSIMNWPKSSIQDMELFNNVKLFQELKRDQIFPDQRQGWVNKNNYFMDLPAPWVSVWGGNMSLCRDLFMDAGLFDEEFAQYGNEDLEFGWRLVHMGAILKLDFQSKGFHFPHPKNRNTIKKWQLASNRYFLEKHPQMDVEMLSRFGILNTNRKIAEISYLLADHKRVEAEDSAVPLFELLKSKESHPILALGCSQETISGIHVDCVLEPDLNVYKRLKELSLNYSPFWLLGIETPFKDNSYQSVLIGDFWQNLPQELLEMVLVEALRVGRDLYLIVTGSINKAKNKMKNIKVLKQISQDKDSSKRRVNIKLENNYFIHIRSEHIVP